MMQFNEFVTPQFFGIKIQANYYNKEWNPIQRQVIKTVVHYKTKSAA